MEYGKSPAKLGERLRIKVRMTPKDTSFFDEIVISKCNTTSPVKVKKRASSVIERKGACLKKPQKLQRQAPGTLWKGGV